ncbi:hypothetical protein KRP22_004966 [Phytophthora ramorum]|uniref:uncharacterized protein n=1 Tax=Phytophthora ramorum TaxID=164328 RepID=UPI00309E0C90|nr:hypothetical protein KRP23_13565 [Phytophthora ramorum]KAH7497487.1 hypothetical protein KRP22_12550 [Phytophthora ramorum]
MVQTIAMNEATLVDGIAKFVAEDLGSLDGEANWWHQRVRLVEHWLRDETSRVCIPDDGTDEMIRRHIQRGDSYPRAQCKCWKHIVMELRDLPCFAGIVARTKADDGVSRITCNASPSRGKLRPGKDLIVLSDDKSSDDNSNTGTHGDDENNNASSSWSLEPLNPETEQPLVLKKPRPLSSATYLSRRELGIDAMTVGSIGKSFSGMSLLERQMEWLQKKHDKMEAERLRQVEENERELTFQPKLIRRITYSGERHFRDTPGVPSSSRSFTRSESSRRVGEAGGAALLKERTLPKVPRLSHRRPKKKTLLQSAAISQPLGVSCKLLDNMKSELQASLGATRSNDNSETDIASAEPVVELQEEVATGEDGATSSENSDTPAEDSQVPETESSAVVTEVSPPENTPAWSAKPTIGGRRADFDSSETKVRLTLQDASKFELNSMYRKTDRRAGRDGVALHVGRREDTFEEQVIAVLFDREKVTEDDAERWWTQHQHRFVQFIEPQQPREEDAALVELPASRAATPGIL